MVKPLGAAPTTSGHLGCILSPTVTWTPNATVNTTNAGSSAYLQGTFTFNTTGTWIICFHLTGLVSTPPNAVAGVYGFGGLGFSAPFITSNNGTSPNINAIAASSFVYNITSSVTFNMFINVFSGSLFTNSGPSTVTFTRIA